MRFLSSLILSIACLSLFGQANTGPLAANLTGTLPASVLPSSSTTNNGTLTANVLIGNGARGVVNGAATGAVPANADGSATTLAQIGSLSQGPVMTNNNVNSFVIFTNNGVSLSVNSIGILTLTNYAAANTGFTWSTNGNSTNVNSKFSGGIGVGTSSPTGTGNIDASGTITASGNVAIAPTANYGWTSRISLDSPSAKEARFAGNGFANMATIYFGISDANTHAICLSNSPPVYHFKDGTRASYIPIVAGSGTFTNTITATNGFLLPTNYVAANFTPLAGMVSIVASNGVLYKVTQLSTNLLSANTP